MDFFYKYKSIIFAVLFLLLSVFIGFIIYSVFFRAPLTTQDGDGTKNGSIGFPSSSDGSGQIIEPSQDGNLPSSTQPTLIPEKEIDEVANGGLTKTKTLVNDPSSNITSSKDGKSLQFYNEYDGKFYTIDKDGNMTALSDRVFYDVKNVSWANSKDKAVIEYPDGANIVYDFDKEKSITLPKHWEDFEFSPDDKQIASKSIGLDPENRWLTISNIDGTNAKKIEPLGNNADSVYTSWSPNNQSIAMFTEGMDLNRQSLYFVGKNEENFKSTVVEGRGFAPLWSNDGKQLLYSVYSTETNLKPTLWIVSAQGEQIGQGRKSLDIETWASKCVFVKSSSVYCAVPQNLKEGAGLFPDLGKTTDDYLYKIDLNNNTKSLIAIPENEMTITNIIVSDDERTVFFTDGQNKAVHKINL